MDQKQNIDIVEQRLKQVEILSNIGLKTIDVLETLNKGTKQYIEYDENMIHKESIDKELLERVIRIQGKTIEIADMQRDLSDNIRRLLDFDIKDTEEKDNEVDK